MAMPQLKNPCSTGHEIYNFGRPFLGHYYYILSLSDLCLGGEKDFLRNHAFLYGHAPAQEPLPRGSYYLQFW